MTTVIKFTDDEKRLLGSLAHAVWEECAYDILQMTAEEEGKSINAVTVSRSVVIEIALDAGRMEERLKSSVARGLATEDLLRRVREADYKTLIAAVKPAFAYARYGM